MTVLALTGWQQRVYALSDIVPDAVHFDYAAYDNADAMFAALPRDTHLAIGWSLGGQLLARAIAGGHIRPKALVLLGAPFQWVRSERFAEGIPLPFAEEARENYRRDPLPMLRNLNALIALGDVYEKRIARALNDDLELWPNGMFWLDELMHASCVGLDFEAFPPTTIVHGFDDKVIYAGNARTYGERLPQTELVLLPGCAHALHLHDAQALRDIIAYV